MANEELADPRSWWQKPLTTEQVNSLEENSRVFTYLLVAIITWGISHSVGWTLIALLGWNVIAGFLIVFGASAAWKRFWLAR